MINRKSETMRILRDVVYQAKLEIRRIRLSRIEFFAFSFLTACILGLDYTMARVMFDYLDPTLGGISLGPEMLALSVPIALIAVHLLIADDKGRTIENRLRKLAGVGVFVFLLGMASMISLVYFDATDGMGAQNQSAAIHGTIGNETVGAAGQTHQSWLSSLFGNLLASIPPIIFFTGMTLILFVTVYASHRLMTKIEARYEFFSKTSKRAHELRRLYVEAEKQRIEIEKDEAALKSQIKKLPRDPQKSFSQIASAAIYTALHRMKKAVNSLGRTDPLIEGVFARKAAIPPHIKSRKYGHQIIAEIRHRSSPYAILKNLGGVPPKEEEE